jgi:HD domain-containing protein
MRNVAQILTARERSGCQRSNEKMTFQPFFMSAGRNVGRIAILVDPEKIADPPTLICLSIGIDTASAPCAISAGGEARLGDIRNRFGDRVADIVRSCSDSVVNSSGGQKKEDWRTRKNRYINHLETVDAEILLVSLSDKVHNARSILRDLRKPQIGSAVWDRFKQSKKESLWYYRELANAFQKLLLSQLSDELMEIGIVLENE